MLNVYLNSGNLIIFEKAKATFENGKLFVNSKPTLNHNFDYEKELKNVYKVVEVMEDCNSLQRELYRGYLLKRGVEVQTTAECSINKKGEIKKWIYY